MLAEFHDRLVRIFSHLLLPFLAVSFAIGSRRTHHAYGIAAGLLILITYNQVLSIGKSLSSIGEVSPFIGQWLPFVLLVIVSISLFYRRAFLVARSIDLPPPLDVIRGLLQGFRAETSVSKRRRPE
jgi:lipopolysaccharide export LptBFGC system permease protein LptF